MGMSELSRYKSLCGGSAVAVAVAVAAVVVGVAALGAVVVIRRFISLLNSRHFSSSAPSL